MKRFHDSGGVDEPHVGEDDTKRMLEFRISVFLCFCFEHNCGFNDRAFEYVIVCWGSGWCFGSLEDGCGRMGGVGS